jgi:hypothetical protein
MSASSLGAVQAAVYTALTNDATFMALCPAVYDAVPETPTYPHAVIGEAVEVSDRFMGQNGHDVLLTVSIFTRDGSTTKAGTGSKGFAAGLAIAARATDRMVEQNVLSVSGHALVLIEVDAIETSREPDGLTRRVDAHYTLVLEDS